MHKNNWTQPVRRLARIWSLLSLAFIFFMFIGEGISDPTLPTGIEWVLLLFFPLGVLLGMLLAWRWERLGGALTTGSLAAFYLLDFSRRGDWAGGPWFLLIAFPGLLFLLLSFFQPDPRGRWV